MRRFVLAALLALAMLGCAGSGDDPAANPASPPTVSAGQPFELAVGQAVTVAETGTRVGLRGVREDSRCPARVSCIWAGRVVLEMEMQAPAVDADSFALSTLDGGQHSYAGQTIDLVGVTPAPGAPGQPIATDDYRAQLLIQLAGADSHADRRPS